MKLFLRENLTRSSVYSFTVENENKEKVFLFKPADRIGRRIDFIDANENIIYYSKRAFYGAKIYTPNNELYCTIKRTAFSLFGIFFKIKIKKCNDKLKVKCSTFGRKISVFLDSKEIGYIERKASLAEKHEIEIYDESQLHKVILVSGMTAYIFAKLHRSADSTSGDSLITYFN